MFPSLHLSSHQEGWASQHELSTRELLTFSHMVSISDLGSIFTSALSALVNVVCRLVYIGYRPPNHILCYITKSTLDITCIA